MGDGDFQALRWPGFVRDSFFVSLRGAPDVKTGGQKVDALLNAAQPAWLFFARQRRIIH